MQISSGIDLVNINRDEFNSIKLVKKTLHPNELIKYNNFDNMLNKKKYIAKIWAIKEAIYKAYNHSYIMNQIEITYKNNKPYCIIDNYYFDISVSYQENYIIAIAIKNQID